MHATWGGGGWLAGRRHRRRLAGGVCCLLVAVVMRVCWEQCGVASRAGRRTCPPVCRLPAHLSTSTALSHSFAAWVQAPQPSFDRHECCADHIFQRAAARPAGRCARARGRAWLAQPEPARPGGPACCALEAGRPHDAIHTVTAAAPLRLEGSRLPSASRQGPPNHPTPHGAAAGTGLPLAPHTSAPTCFAAECTPPLLRMGGAAFSPQPRPPSVLPPVQRWLCVSVVQCRRSQLCSSMF
jgi:hypothetical protein